MADPIPIIYRFMFNWAEPIYATLGAIQLYISPISFLEAVHPGIVSSFTPAYQAVMIDVTGGWLALAFNDAVTLRAFKNDVKVWRYVLTAHLVSDIITVCAMIQDPGLIQTANPWLWSAKDWAVASMTYPALVLKIAFLLGIGVGGPESHRKTE